MKKVDGLFFLFLVFCFDNASLYCMKHKKSKKFNFIKENQSPIHMLFGNPNRGLLHAAYEGNALLAQDCLNHDADPNASNILAMTALIIASMKGHADVVKF